MNSELKSGLSPHRATNLNALNPLRRVGSGVIEIIAGRDIALTRFNPLKRKRDSGRFLGKLGPNSQSDIRFSCRVAAPVTRIKLKLEKPPEGVGGKAHANRGLVMQGGWGFMRPSYYV